MIPIPTSQLLRMAVLVLGWGLFIGAARAGAGEGQGFAGLREINPPSDPDPGQVLAIVGARLVDGCGHPPVADAVLVIRGGRIAAAGSGEAIGIPPEVQVFEAAGLTVLPGLVDTHFHNDGGAEPIELPALVLSRGITTLRDPSLRLVVGSHTAVPHAERGWAYQRELELLVECGLSPAEAITAATRRGAEALGCADRLGSLEPGKLADLVLVEGDPLADIRAMRSVRHVMLNGRWVGEPPRPRSPAPGDRGHPRAPTDDARQ